MVVNSAGYDVKLLLDFFLLSSVGNNLLIREIPAADVGDSCIIAVGK